jgi:branched-subunit amino acid aminotransferase/4-amino-4-deoxychorismate lyase
VSQAPYVEVDGSVPEPERLRALALEGYGHFTAMQVRASAVRGLGLHLERLDRANREVFGAPLPAELVRAHIRHALAQTTPDASVRVRVTRPAGERAHCVMVVVRPPGPLPGGAVWRLRSAPYQRSLAHIKHLGDFGQQYYGQLAEREGYDDALLYGADGLVSETSMANVGFLSGTTVVWPAAPLLAGITMQLLQAALPGHGLSWRLAPVRLADLDGFTGVFVSNARGIAPVGDVDGRALPVDEAMMRRLAEVYDAAPAEPL